LSSSISPCRTAAFDVLRRVESGGYASDLLLRETAGLDSRDAGLAARVVFGCLRFQAQLDFLIDRFSGRRAQFDAEVRIALRMGIYQIRYMDRIPRHAAVSESVELVKHARKRSAAGFANAVLRKVNDAPVAWPDRSVELSCPAWLLDRWDRQFGRDASNAIARAALEEPDLYIRDSGEPRLWTGGELPPGARIQDIGSQSIVPLLDLRPGDSFLDLCAAPGNKTAQALESGVHAIACDVHWKRLKMLDEIAGCRRVALDATVSLPFAGRFDRILVDAPCSGTGTLGRNPEIKWRLRPSDLESLHAVQVRILANAADRLNSAGRLVYSTCSLEPEENRNVVDNILAEHPALRLHEARQRLPGRDPGDGFYAAVLTSEKSANG
jgi:16S rRNA (cytosine967-C5)-methyltransferase